MTEHRDRALWQKAIDAVQAGVTRIGRRVRAVPRRYPVACIVIAFALIAAVGYWRTQQLADRQAAANHKQVTDNSQRINAETTLNAGQSRIIDALHADLHCIERWANRTTARSQKLTPLANARIEQLFAAFRAALNGHTVTARARAERAIREDERYLRESRRHPIPTPELHCRLVIPERPAPRPSVSVSVRVSRVPGPVRTVPGPVRVIRLPGRTVVVTVTPGKHRGRR